MKIINELPPIYESILLHGMKPTAETIYTYGDAIYNPNSLDIPDHLMIHEETHSKQQGDDPDAWWGRYLVDAYFRIEQETEAYAKQFAYIATRIKDRNQRHRILIDLSRMLSSPIYGNIITADSAYKMIKTRSGVRP